MIRKKILLPLSIVVLFCFSTTCIASNLPFGIIDAVESRIGELQGKQAEEKITYIQATTESSGRTVVHDGTHNISVLVSTVDQAGTSIGGIQFEYINTGRTIICIVRNNPNYLPSFAIEPFQQSNGSVGHKDKTVGPQLRVAGIVTTTIFIVITIVLSAYGTYELIFEDPPYIETIRHDSGWVEKRLYGDIEDIIDLLGVIPFVNFKSKWVRFVVSAGKAISGKAARKGLGAIGIDPYKKYCYTLYESRHDSTSKAPFMYVQEDVKNTYDSPTVKKYGVRRVSRPIRYEPTLGEIIAMLIMMYYLIGMFFPDVVSH